MKVILRIQKGITTKAIEIPDSCVRSDFRLPVYKEIGLRAIRDIQEYITAENTHNKCLVFRWNHRDTWGNSTYPIMDLVDVL